MKILELTRSFYPSIGGMEKFVADRLKIYKSLGYEYQVITTTHSEKKLATAQRMDKVKYLSSYTPYEIVPSLKKTLNLNYDILSVNQVGYSYSAKAIEFAKAKGKKIILTPHFYFHTKRYKIIKDIHFNFFISKILKDVDKIICFTNFETDYWRANFPFVNDKIVIIPHYFDPPRLSKVSFKNEYDKFFLFLGRGEVNKRIDLLINAFDNIETDYHLILTIDKDEILPKLKIVIEKNKRIHLLGRIPENEKQNLLATAEALILPTDYEAFGIVSLEASFYKKPLLLSELSVFKCILPNEGVIYFKNNIEDLMEAIKKFLKMSDKEKIEMGITNFYNLRNFEFKSVARKYHQLITSLFNSK